jgi:hypothetical protein
VAPSGRGELDLPGGAECASCEPPARDEEQPAASKASAITTAKRSRRGTVIAISKFPALTPADSTL